MNNRIQKKTAYLTIDDGPSKDWREKLDFLNGLEIKAVWFCQGCSLEQYPDFFPAAVESGHSIGNHSYDHPDFSQISLAAARNQICITDELLSRNFSALGITDYPKWFRFPYGNRGDRDPQTSVENRIAKRNALQSILKELGYSVPDFPEVTYTRFHEWREDGGYDWWWTFDCKEWALDPAFAKYNLFSLDDLIRRIKTGVDTDEIGLTSGSSAEVVLIHDLAHSTQLFKPLINTLLTIGLEFQSPGELAVGCKVSAVDAATEFSF